MSDWREWLEQAQKEADEAQYREDMGKWLSDHGDRLMEGFKLLAEVHEAKAALDEHNKSCDWAFLGKNSACLNCMKLQQKHAGAHEAADDFLRGVDND